ncbi:bifunctional cobalt-precorrin-7 (C(5))-methyltransferase/cobalt-precorrin-6B (C(15))-methyltransferase [Beijerinckia indica]|uniref:Precorrin-6y C5,15-methyltransferase (Decarboxylating), CbiE subunit n=1 Tax=Beijerinckia indica subsp. indica (strain ATCC 9039 / DSM 1715 / NCIMB 8712) TaxID=395963 RepID=B2IFH0_BEII9|nr:bifunctional cobalt-precorrin-7 (C(5))-methyltransferase/cobalt-precorrin-6B (C(15))-methyltransferase [Beijerinckia indica]ACB97070.1 precorrin-6y C5,15-methyltransferase (decarboxylating), CbiE subunit [Beijerinckia indica subsp. indica ATCC 9039]
MSEKPRPWLSLIGIGEDGRAGLSPLALDLLNDAHFVLGGARHLALAGPLKAECRVWPSPLTDALPMLQARRGTPVCVLASGDPFFYGVGSLIARTFPVEEISCLPMPSAFSLAAARLGWPLQDCRLISLHGRPFERIIPELQPGAKILCLAWDGSTAPRLAALLRERGFGASRIIVLEAMGGPNEHIWECRADALEPRDIAPLNLVALNIVAEDQAQILPLGSGLEDSWFEHDGQITKREIRAEALSALAPHRGALLWDIGAGSGSIGIEWMLLDPANKTIAIESRADRAERISRNARALGVPDLIVVQGKAPEALANLPRPDGIFIGGGASQPGLIEQALAALPKGGRLVVHAVTLETEATLFHHYQALGGDLIRLAISRIDRLGGFHTWRPALPIVQWSFTKGKAP